MPDNWDKLLFEIGEEADSAVDYEAMRLALRAHARAERAKKRERLRAFSMVAACFVVLLGVGFFASRTGFKAQAPEAVPMAVPAAEPAPAAAAAVAEDIVDMEAPMTGTGREAAPAEPTAASAAMTMAGESVAEESVDFAVTAGRDGGGPSFDRAAMRGVYPTLLVNRANTISREIIPSEITTITADTLPNITLKKQGMQAYPEALDALANMLAGAQRDGVEGFYLVSVYRDYAEQDALWQKKLAKDPAYGQDGPVASLPPDASEHRTGLAFDITAVTDKAMSAAFAETQQGQWLYANCAAYGFILRYPEGAEDITGVVFEPWHFRYVGEDLSLYLTGNGITMEEFYNE